MSGVETNLGRTDKSETKVKINDAMLDDEYNKDDDKMIQVQDKYLTKQGKFNQNRETLKSYAVQRMQEIMEEEDS